MIPVVTCPSCKLAQFGLQSSLDPNSKSAVCRRCRAPLGFSVVEVSLNQINPQSKTSPNVLLGSTLRSLRRTRHQTQLGLAQLVRTSRSQISRLETNVVSPNMEMYMRILCALGVTNIYLRLAEPDQAHGKLHARN